MSILTVEIEIEGCRVAVTSEADAPATVEDVNRLAAAASACAQTTCEQLAAVQTQAPSPSRLWFVGPFRRG